jgi:hypothetical protein
MEKILEIYDVDNEKEDDLYGWGEGFIVKTDKQEIRMLISNSQSCCESFGHFSSNDDIKEFIGANLLEIKLVDTCLNVKKLQDGVSQDDTIFVNLETDRGILQFAVYNSHNGYYGHEVIIRSNQLNKNTGL